MDYNKSSLPIPSSVSPPWAANGRIRKPGRRAGWLGGVLQCVSHPGCVSHPPLPAEGGHGICGATPRPGCDICERSSPGSDTVIPQESRQLRCRSRDVKKKLFYFLKSISIIYKIEKACKPP